MEVYSQLEVASLENLASDPSLLPEGRIWLNTTTNTPKIRANSVTKFFMTASSLGTSGQLLTSTGSADPTWTTATYPATVTAPAVMVGNTNNTFTALSGSTANRLLKTNGTAVSFSQADLTTDVTGTLPIANGGTNSTVTPTAGGVSYGTGTAFAFTTAGTSGQFFISNGASAPAWSSSSSAAFTFSNATDSTTTSTGAIITSGGIGVAKAVSVGTQINLVGGQIVFPATQNASAGGNTLDDYEEGTFTAGLSFSGGTGTATISLQQCNYTKIGNRVSYSMFVRITKGTGTGNLTITGLPFTAKNTANLFQACAVSVEAGVTLPANRSVAQAYVNLNSTNIIPEFNSTTGGAATSITAADLGTTADFLFCGSYESST